MQHDYSLSIATTASAVVGGVTRALSEQMSSSTISVHGILDLAAYAVVSASVGYCVKLTLDLIYQKFRNRKTKK
jgi:hypothetical protein